MLLNETNFSANEIHGTCPLEDPKRPELSLLTHRFCNDLAFYHSINQLGGAEPQKKSCILV